MADGREDQLRLALGPFQNRRLFSDHFLKDRLPEWPEFAVSAPHRDLQQRLDNLWRAEREGLGEANEAQTEDRWVQPVLRALGFAYTVQAGLRVGSGRRQPDYALFLDDNARAEADRLTGAERYAQALAVADAKRFDRPLEGRGRAGALSEDPVAQIIHYISVTRRRWGVLTNGRLWRLYGAAGDLVEGACYEVDLVALLEADDPAAFRYFALFFGAEAFAPDREGRSFLDRALDESRANAVEVGDALERSVFTAVPLIAEGLLGDDERSEEGLGTAFDHALVLLYRLLFCLHAEARALLPVDNRHYVRYGLARLAGELAGDIAAGRVFSTRSDDLYNDLRALFRIVDEGDSDLGVPEYDGGLFSADGHPWFAGRSVPDALLAPALDGLFRVGGESVDYRALAVRHLGTIYERLLDFRLVEDAGRLRLAPATGRHAAGAYFTPAQVVDRIVERTLEPLLMRRSTALADTGASSSEALEHFLELRVLDPAMGSGHFLVSAAAFIAQYIATDPSYQGDLALVELQRLVAERCLYGVDLNPMAVELAQLSLWLTTVQRGEPLTFLHNLRVGNSLVGADLSRLLAGGTTLFAERLGQDARELLAQVDAIEHEASHSGKQVHEKERLARTASALRQPLERFADETVAPSFPGGAGRFLHWELEFPEVFLSLDGGMRDDRGFDAIIGNPPYVRIQELGRELATYCRREYATASGSFDVYVPFLERGIKLLSRSGRLGFILPNKLLKLEFGQGLRELLASEGLVEEIVDFGDAQLFVGATNYTCILVLDRAGGSTFAYRRVRGGPSVVERALVNLDALPAEQFSPGDFGGDPWVLATGEEARVLRAIATGTERLGDVTEQIFQGLITSADDVFILGDRGVRGTGRLVRSRVADQELELEPDLLRPLASGGDVGRYAFEPLDSLLVFPYVRDGGRMRLISREELARLPLTEAYLLEHEERLRSRESRRMDHDGWYGYVYPKSLGAHDRPKLGVAATVRRLEVAADLAGGVYFHNVRVNGILGQEGGLSLPVLLTLLNSRLLDWFFRRGAAPHAGGHYAANKQFIAPLPIRLPDPSTTAELERLGTRLQAGAAAAAAERRGFVDWLGDALGTRARELPGATILRQFDQHAPAELLAVLGRRRAALATDPGTRAFRELLVREHTASVERLAALRIDLTAAERTADDAVYELYGVDAAARALVDAEYVST